MTAMTVAEPHVSRWKRFWRRLAEVEEAMSLGYEGWQDRRIDQVEAELRSFKDQIAELQQKRSRSS